MRSSAGEACADETDCEMMTLSATHVTKVVPLAKMDTPTGLYTWVCLTCGRCTGMIGSWQRAQRAGKDHEDAKNVGKEEGSER